MRWLRPRPSGETASMRTRRPHPTPVPRSAFSGFRSPPDVIVLAVRWYLRFGLSYRDVEELLVERGVAVDHVTIYRWVLRFTRHCCIEPECAGEAHQSGGSPSWKGAEKGSNHSTVPMICRLWAAKWRQSHGVIAQCNSALASPVLAAQVGWAVPLVRSCDAE